MPDDLYAPGEEYVFGLARPERGTAVVSTARLHNHFYGRVPCDDDLMDRVAKEGAHEVGHLLGLEHCAERECVMYAPRSLDELDRKRKMVCPACAALLRGGAGESAALPPPAPPSAPLRSASRSRRAGGTRPP